MTSIEFVRRNLFILVFLLATSAFAERDICLAWFKKTKVSSTDKECVYKCRTSSIDRDMSNALCVTECPKFCTPKKCEPDSYWKAKIKTNRPKNWDFPSEQTISWTDSEQQQVLHILSRLPEKLKQIPLQGIYRMKTSVTRINPATTTEDGKNIVIYDRAFENPFWSTQEVIIHELGHVVYQNMGKAKQENYKVVMGWKNQTETSRPQDNFISSAAKHSEQEDFAENFKFYLLDKDILKNKVKKAYHWLFKEYKNIDLKKGC